MNQPTMLYQFTIIVVCFCLCIIAIFLYLNQPKRHAKNISKASEKEKENIERLFDESKIYDNRID